jgi:transglutaminase-like putative cysteine protease
MRRFPRPAPEDSLAVRVATLLAVLVAVGAIGAQEEFAWRALLAAGAIVAGFVVSHVRRRAANWWLKAAITASILIVARDFFVSLVANPYDPRIPLVQLFLWLQVLHSFDLPARKDLKYSLASAVVLLAVAAVYARDAAFGWFLLLFVFAAAAAWIAMQVAPGTLPLHTLVRLGGRLSTAVVLSAVLVFAATPRSEGLRIRWMPVSPHLGWAARLHGRIVNPAYPDLAGRDPEQAPAVFNPQGYVGFSTFVDLRLRGVLHDELVMRVRTTRRAYWRGLAFDAYTGRGWRMTDRAVEEYSSDQPRIVPRLGADEPWPAGSEQVVQTFYIEAAQPNVIFAAYRPFELYFPTGMIGVDRYAGLRSPVMLEAGVIYSVISRVPEPAPALLKRARGEVPAPIAAHYLSLPPMPDRVQRLAEKLTAGQESPYLKALAIQRFFQRAFAYTLQAPELPDGSDAVDHFLFVTRQGSCEIFASAMAVLLRAAGIPTRLVTGYTTGAYNVLTGYYEVRNSDAHAWVEMFQPGVGWVEIEATPSFESAADFTQQPVGQWLARDAAGWVIGAVSRVARGLSGRLPAHLLMALLGLIAVGLLAGGWMRVRPSRHVRRSLTPIEGSYAAMLKSLARRGFVRGLAATPREFAASLPLAVRSPAERVTRLFETIRYGQRPSDTSSEAACQAALTELRATMRGRGGRHAPHL